MTRGEIDRKMRAGVARIAAGYLIAPGVPAFFMYAAQLATGISHEEAVLASGVVALVSYVAALLLGIPVCLVLFKLKIHDWWIFLLAGAVVGALGALSVEAHKFLRPDISLVISLETVLRSWLLAAPCGALGGFAFWVIAIRGAAAVDPAS